MNSIVEAVRTCDLRQAKQLIQYIKESGRIIQAAATNASVGSDGETTALLEAIQSVNTPNCGFAVIQLLLVQYDSGNADTHSAVHFVNACVQAFSSITLAHATMYYADTIRLSHALATVSCQIRCAKRTIRCLNNLCTVLLSAGADASPITSTLTAVHADVLQVCIAAHMYSYALRFINAHRILDINPPIHAITSEDFLRYYYYAGLCYISVKAWSQAIYFLNEVVLTPAEHISAIAVEALKKLKLISLIHTGKKYELPEGISHCILKLFRRSASEEVSEGGGGSTLMGRGTGVDVDTVETLRVYDTITDSFLRHLEESPSPAWKPVEITSSEASGVEGMDAGSGTAEPSASSVGAAADGGVGGGGASSTDKATLYEVVCVPTTNIPAILQADHNTGLALQCIVALLAHKLTCLGEIYAVLPVPDCLSQCHVFISMIQLSQRMSANTSANAGTSTSSSTALSGSEATLLQAVAQLSQQAGSDSGSGSTLRVVVDRLHNALVFHPELLPTYASTTGAATTSGTDFTAADLALLKQKLDENVHYSKVLRALQSQVLQSEAYIRNVNAGQLEHVEQYAGMSITGDIDLDM